MLPFPSTDPSMYPRIAKERSAVEINRRPIVFCLQKGHRVACFSQAQHRFLRRNNVLSVISSLDIQPWWDLLLWLELYNRICLTWTQRLIVFFSFFPSDEEYEEEEEEEEYEEEVQTNPDEYEILFSAHSLYQKYIRQIHQYICSKFRSFSAHSLYHQYI